MGYRTYIASIPKREYNKIKSMNEEQLKQFYSIETESDSSTGKEYWYKSFDWKRNVMIYYGY